MEQQKVVWSRTIWPPPFQVVTNLARRAGHGRPVVGDVRQARAVAGVGGAPRAGAARLRVRGRAQLERVRQDQERHDVAHEPRGRRQARVLPRGAAPQGEAADRELQPGGRRVWDTDEDSDKEDEEADLAA